MKEIREEDLMNETPDELTPFQKDMIHRFSFHPATTPEKQNEHASIRMQCLKLTSYIDAVVPDGREKSLAITKLEEVMMWANAGIARNNNE